jgi:putative colanic acid biosynthesis acetyltransferase WcaF
VSKTDLSKYNGAGYSPGAGKIKQILWYFTNILYFKNAWNPISGLKVRLLRLFGAKVGLGVVIKPAVNIKYPWRLKIGNHVWIGENVWIDNLADVEIADNVCVSQGAMLLTGSHDYSKTTFDVITEKITLEDGVWIGAKSVVYPGVTCKSHSILSVNSVAMKDLDAYFIYTGNPVVKISKRDVK